MTNVTIIWDAISVMIKDDHPILYQYIKGSIKGKTYAITRLSGIITPIFIGAYDDVKINYVVREYLKQKEIDYTNGLVVIKSLYH